MQHLFRLILLAWLLTLCGLAVSQEADAPPADAPPADAPAAEAVADGEATEGEAAAPPPQPLKLDKWNDAHSIGRAKSFALSWPKVLGIWLLLLVWIRSVDWVNRDSQINDLGYGKWNVIVFFPVLAVLLFAVLPVLLPIPVNYFLALGLFAVVYLATFIPYVVVRNRAVEKHQRVFTGEWFRYEFAMLANKVGIKMAAERKADYEKGAPVDLMAMGADDDRDNQANLITARQSPGYLTLKELVAEMATKRSDQVLLDYTQQSVVQRDHIDGVWHNGEARDRESGDVMLAVMKTLANLDMSERRKKQRGHFGAKYDGTSYICHVSSQGVKTGERVSVELQGGHQDQLDTFAELGMRDKMAQRWNELLGRDKGLLIISAMPQGGLTTLTDVSLLETDRLMRDFVSIEEAKHREREIENIEAVTYSAADGQTPDSILTGVIRKYPNVIVCRDFVNPETAKILLKEVNDDRLIITCTNAKDAPETLLRMLQKKVPQREFASVVTAVLNTRLIRKLCDECKVGYEPSPELLKKLGIPAGKVEMLYRVPKGEEIDKPCKKCAGMGYYGRTGLFELLVVNDKIREILVKQPKLDLLRKAARAAGLRNMQEEAILLVARGLTSIQELQRVLKQ